MIQTTKTRINLKKRFANNIVILLILFAMIFAGYSYITRAIGGGNYNYNYGNAVSAAAPNTASLRIPVLAYHSILSQEYFYPINVNNPWIMSEDLFRRHMQYLYDNNFTPITSAQLIKFLYCDCQCDCMRMPENPVLITFDDGYLDNALFAAPILREFGFTAMLFVITDRLAEEQQTMAAHPIPWMTELDMRMNFDVFEVGSHTHNLHNFIGSQAALAVTSREDIRADLRRSFQFPLNMRQGFAYPFGIVSDTAIAALRDEGVRFAFTTDWGYVTNTSDPFRLPRFNITASPDCLWNDIRFFSSIVRGTLEF